MDIAPNEDWSQQQLMLEDVLVKSDTIRAGEG